jgi:hypothetical protein
MANVRSSSRRSVLAAPATVGIQLTRLRRSALTAALAIITASAFRDYQALNNLAIKLAKLRGATTGD